MTLISLTFIIFFILVLAVYYSVPKKLQWCVLLAASILFYLCSATPYTFIYVLISIGTVYFSTGRIEKVDAEIAENESLKEKLLKKKKRVYIVAVVICVGMLAALKYMNFFLGNVNIIAGWFGKGEVASAVHWTASLGISFYTLQMVGYLTDVYWGISKPQKNIAKLALFNCYFPQIISGPVSRYREIEKDLFGEHRADGKAIYLGFLRILTGFFKKLVITEHLTQVTNYIYDNPAEYGGIFVWIGTALYVIEIYADFSGCMDIIMGVSECFGIRLPENFRTPFCSVTIQEFWQRWHITLGTWLKDYIMYPILRSGLWSRFTRFSKRKWGRRAARLLPTFSGMLILWLLMGLWHGGGWNYIGEGIWFWAVIALGQTLAPLTKKIKEKLKISQESKLWYCFRCMRTTFIYAVGALFFKAGNLTKALYMIKTAFSPHKLVNTMKLIGPAVLKIDASVGTMQLGWTAVSVIIGTVIMVLLGKWEKDGHPFREWMVKQNVFVNGAVLYVIIFMILLLGAYGPGYSASEFIYGGF